MCPAVHWQEVFIQQGESGKWCCHGSSGCRDRTTCCVLGQLPLFDTSVEPFPFMDKVLLLLTFQRRRNDVGFASCCLCIVMTLVWWLLIETRGVTAAQDRQQHVLQAKQLERDVLDSCCLELNLDRIVPILFAIFFLSWGPTTTRTYLLDSHPSIFLQNYSCNAMTSTISKTPTVHSCCNILVLFWLRFSFFLDVFVSNL